MYLCIYIYICAYVNHIYIYIYIGISKQICSADKKKKKLNGSYSTDVEQETSSSARVELLLLYQPLAIARPVDCPVCKAGYCNPKKSTVIHSDESIPQISSYGLDSNPSHG